VEPWGRHHRHQAAEQRQRVEVDGDGAVRERPLECDTDPVVADSREPLLGERRAEGVADQRLATGWIMAAGDGRRVQGKAPIAHQ
jgi:hypothetical protein